MCIRVNLLRLGTTEVRCKCHKKQMYSTRKVFSQLLREPKSKHGEVLPNQLELGF